jgi:glyoxylase-like metal-dependent hydrolase (beta-lactamase superfamily II)
VTRPSIYAVRYGSQRTNRRDFYLSWSSYDEADSVIEMAYYFWVVRGGARDRVTLVDTGFSEAEAHHRGRTIECAPAHALAELEIDPKAVSTVVITHLHYDHAGNLDLFPNAEIVLSRREFEFWTSNPLAARRLFAQHTDQRANRLLCNAHADGRVRLIDDAVVDLTSEVRLIRVGGHTPGQLVVDVAGSEQRVVLASDAVHFYEELANDRPPSVLTNLAEHYDGFDTLAELAAAGRRIVPGHDPAILREYPSVDLDAPVVQLA